MAAHVETSGRWKQRAAYWYGMFAGTSYYHQPQAIGRAFEPGLLRGYFNDLTGKTNWQGESDAEGLPLSKLSNGNTVHFPILVCQKALGHWDLWLLTREEAHRHAFLTIAEWLIAAQDSAGGWNTWQPLGQPEQYRYSAMTQGQALSVMLRAMELAPDAKYEAACKRAVTLMSTDVRQGGVCWNDGKDVFLEEYPAEQRDTVLNGWIFALFGLHDYLLRFEDEQVVGFYTQSRASLARNLPQFDTGYWSYYSNASKRLASPFYHRLHLSQLEALSRTCSDTRLTEVKDRWAAYEKNTLFKSWAVARKALQKLREPAEITIVG